ncbi:DUF2179 domain-containing protein [Ammoniphilus sp. 3BR4]|uniref:DUF2179 domain-containing protein n=1 Tax=Ammoniphilus sp. 3BR4 TaxID=3158265 RepID=UPI003466E760
MGYEILLTIIVINVLYVSFFTLRMILVIKGYRLFASLLSMIEVFVYLKGLAIVLDNLNNPINLAAYCIGWGMGVYLGSRIEEYMALGHVTIQVVVDSIELDLPDYLRQQGFGVTSWLGDGKDGKRLVMQVLAKRSNERKLLEFIQNRVPKAFVISYEPKQLKGGFWVKHLKG